MASQLSFLQHSGVLFVWHAVEGLDDFASVRALIATMVLKFWSAVPLPFAWGAMISQGDRHS